MVSLITVFLGLAILFIILLMICMMYSMVAMLLIIADDAGFYQTISSSHICNILQQDISTWVSSHWCLVTQTSVKWWDFERSYEQYNYTTLKSGILLPLNQCNEAQGLGVVFVSNLKFSQHNKMIRKANNIIVDIYFTVLTKLSYGMKMLRYVAT